MALLAQASNVGLQTPKTVSQRPFILYIAGVDRIGRVSTDSWRLTHHAVTEPATLEFVLDDQSATLGASTLQIGDPVTWIETAPNGGLGRILFNGTIKRITPELGSVYANWRVTCVDYSEVLDYSRPIIFEARPAETDRERIQFLLGNFALREMSGSGIANTAVLNGTTLQKMTLRQAIEQTLTAAGSGRNYYIDVLGFLHTYSGLEGTAAPYNITDTNPNGTTTVPASVKPVIDGSNYVDGVYVIGGNLSGSGLVLGTATPLAQPRYAYVDAPQSFDPGMAYTVAQGELVKRQTITRCQAIVSEYDGWALGQTVTLTEGPLGWVARQFQITALSMRVESGTGKREYTLDLGPSGAIGKTTSLRARLEAEAANRQQAQSAGMIPGALSEGSLINPHGYSSGLRILDGVSDVFKIIASGTLELTVADATSGLVTVSLPALGVFSQTPSHQAYLALGNVSTDARTLGSGWFANFANSWVSPTMNGTNSRQAVTTQVYAQVFTNLDAQGIATVSLRVLNHTGGSNTVYARYYILQEVAM